MSEPVQLHSTSQHSTAQHSTAQHSTAQHSTAQSYPVSKKLKVLYVCSWYTPYDAHGSSVDEGHVFFTDFAKSMQEYCDTAVYIPFDDSISNNFNDEYEWGVRTFRARLKKWPHIRFISRIRRMLHFLKGFMKIRRTFKPDIIHAHAAMEAGLWSSVISKLFTRIPVIITEHMPMEYIHPENNHSRFWYHLSYKWAAYSVCVSTDSQARLSEVFKDIDFKLIYNGIKDIPHDSTGKKYRREGYINCDIVGAFYAKDVKGYQYLLPAIKILTQDMNISVMLHILGGGTYLEYYKNMAEELGIMNNCIFYGNCKHDDVYAIVSEMDFGISASIFECSGVSVEETMIIGKPLVVTRSGGANSLIPDYGAIVVDKGSTEALVNGIKEMSERYMTFDSKAIHDYAQETFGAEKVKRQYLELYHECVKTKM